VRSRRAGTSRQTATIAHGATAGRVRYGLDAPPVVAAFVVMGLLGTVFLILTAIASAPLLGAGLWLGVIGWLTAALMVHSSLRGKRILRYRVLDRLPWRGDEDVVDLGTGSGLMLLGAAVRAPRGSATGIDLWRSSDQAGSRPERVLANAAALGVADRVRIVTGDISAPQLPDTCADLVLACLVIHNIHDRHRRRAAISEVFSPGIHTQLHGPAGVAGQGVSESSAISGVTPRRQLQRVNTRHFAGARV
jgi:arsenite methyltransferase